MSEERIIELAFPETRKTLFEILNDNAVLPSEQVILLCLEYNRSSYSSGMRLTRITETSLRYKPLSRQEMNEFFKERASN